MDLLSGAIINRKSSCPHQRAQFVFPRPETVGARVRYACVVRASFERACVVRGIQVNDLMTLESTVISSNDSGIVALHVC